MIYSQDQGHTWNQATWNAPWTARSNFASAAQPGSNYIMFTGGSGSTAGQVWGSWDGIGAVWTMMT